MEEGRGGEEKREMGLVVRKGQRALGGGDGREGVGPDAALDLFYIFSEIPADAI